MEGPATTPAAAVGSPVLMSPLASKAKAPRALLPEPGVAPGVGDGDVGPPRARGQPGMLRPGRPTVGWVSGCTVAAGWGKKAGPVVLLPRCEPRPIVSPPIVEPPATGWTEEGPPR